MSDKDKLKLDLKTFEKIEAETMKYEYNNVNENIKHLAIFAIKVLKDEKID